MTHTRKGELQSISCNLRTFRNRINQIGTLKGANGRSLPRDSPYLHDPLQFDIGMKESFFASETYQIPRIQTTYFSWLKTRTVHIVPLLPWGSKSLHNYDNFERSTGLVTLYSKHPCSMSRQSTLSYRHGRILNTISSSHRRVIVGCPC